MCAKQRGKLESKEQQNKLNARLTLRYCVLLTAVAILLLALTSGVSVAAMSDTASQDMGQFSVDSQIQVTPDTAQSISPDNQLPQSGLTASDRVLIDHNSKSGANTTQSENKTANSSTASTESVKTVVYSFEEGRVLERTNTNVVTKDESPTHSVPTTIEQQEVVSQANDDRERVSDPWEHDHEPYQATVQLETNSGVCTGTVVGDFHVLTAAHCVYDQENGEWYESITATPATDRDEWSGPQITPFSKADVQMSRVYESYINGEGGDCAGDTCPVEDDIALLTLDRSLGAQEEIHQMQWWAYDSGNQVYDEAFIVTQGYPGVPPNSAPYPSMWFDSGDATGEFCRLGYLCNEDTITADLTTSGGQSGAPLYHYSSENERYEILGVVKGGSGNTTVGPRITYDKSSDLFDWISEDRNEKHVDLPEDKPNYVFESVKFTGEESDGIRVGKTDEVVLDETEIAVEHTVRNVGTATGDQVTVQLYAAESAGTCEPGNRDVMLASQSFSPPDPYESRSVAVSTTIPEDLGAGTHDLCLSVSSGANTEEFSEHQAYEYSETQSVSTVEPAEFAVEILSTEIVDGSLYIESSAENTGGTAGTQDLVVSVGGTEQCRDELSLPAGSSETKLCSYELESSDSGTLKVTARSEDQTATTTVTPESATFRIASAITNSPVVAGESLAATATVENIGEIGTEKEVTVSIPALGSDTKSVSVPAGSTEDVEFAVPTATGDNGTYTATIESPDDTVSTSVTVERQPLPPTYELEIIQAESIQAGERFELTASVTNTGDRAGTKSVALSVPGLGSDSASVQLGAGETTQTVLSVETTAGDSGVYNATVTTPDSTASTDITVTEQPDGATFAIGELTTNSPIEPGEFLNATVGVKNIGDTEDNTTVTLTVPGVGTASQPLTLAAGSSDTIEMTVGTTEGDAGNYTVTAAAGADDEKTNISVVETSDGGFQISNPEPQTITTQPGDVVTISSTVTNTGQSPETQEVELRGPDGTVVNKTDVTLAATEATTVTFSYAAGAQSRSGVTLNIVSRDDSVSVPLTVTDGETASYRYHVPFTNDQRELSSAKTSVLRLTAQNTTASVTIDVNANGTSTRTLSIEPGESVGITEPAPGAEIESTQPLSVYYRYRSSNFGAYEDGELTYGIPEESVLGSDYVLPVATDAVWLAAPTQTVVDVDKDGDGASESTVTVPTDGSVQVTEIPAGTQLSADAPVHMVAKHADWKSMDQTYAYTPLATGQARQQYTINAEPSYSRENPESRSAVVVAGTADNTTVEFTPKRGDDETQTLQAGETYSFTTQKQLNLTASKPVVPIYSYHVVATDPWTSTRRGYLATWTPVADQQVRHGSWNGVSEHVSGWSTFDINPPTAAPTIEWTQSPPANAEIGEEITIAVAGSVGQQNRVSIVAESDEDSAVVTTERVTKDWAGSTWDLTVGEDVPADPGANLTLRAVVGSVESPTADTRASLRVLKDTDTQVRIEAPSQPVPATESVEVPVVVTDTPAGISAYNVTVSLSNESVGTVRDVTLTNNPEFPNAVIRSNTTVVVAAGMGNNTFQPSTESVIGTITVQTQIPGTTAISVEQQQVTGNQLTEYQLSPPASNEIEVTASSITPDPVVRDIQPRDPDSDGVFEDIDGDGSVDIFDVQALYQNLGSEPVQDHPQAFNFAGDETPQGVTIFDVQALYRGVSQ